MRRKVSAASLVSLLAGLSAITATSGAAVGATAVAPPGGSAASSEASSDATAAESTLYAWGANSYGQLGIGTTNTSSVPVAVSFPAGVSPIAVAANEVAAYAIGSNGKLYAWGDNSLGELGNGSTVSSSSTPVRVALPKGVVPTALAAGGATGYAIGSDGNLYAWGDNEYGILGNGTTDEQGNLSIADNNSFVPIKVEMPAGVSVRSVATGNLGGSYALGSDGNLYGWGGGNSVYTYGPLTPQVVSIPSTIGPVAVAGNGSTPDLPLGPTYLLGSNGTIEDWGSNHTGELGNGTTSATTSPAPLTVPAGVTVQSIAAGIEPDVGITGYAITTAKQLLAWGNNQYGQLGTGTATGPDSCPGYDFAVSCSTAPVAGLSGNETTAVASSGLTTYALSQPISNPTGARVYSWGAGSSGQLGDGSTTGDNPTPGAISFPNPGTPTAVAAGDNSGYAIVATSAPTISGSPSSTVVDGVPLSYAFTLGGMPNPTTTVAAGSLPPGLTLSTAGVLSGTPTTLGTYDVTVKASNGIAPKATDSFVIKVEAAPSITKVTFKGSSTNPSIVLTGNGFGSVAPTPAYPPGPCPNRGRARSTARTSRSPTSLPTGMRVRVAPTVTDRASDWWSITGATRRLSSASGTTTQPADRGWSTPRTTMPSSSTTPAPRAR